MREAGGFVTDVRDRDYFDAIYFREPRGILFEIATLSPGFAVDEEPGHLGESLRVPKMHAHLRDRLEQTLTPVTNPRVARREGAARRERPHLPGAPGRRPGRGAAGPPPRPRRRRARPAVARRHARPGAPAARRGAARAARAAGLARVPLVRRPQVGRPDPDTWHAAFAALSAFHDELWERTGLGPERTVLGGFSMGTVMSYSLGLDASRPAPAGILAFSGFVPVVEGWAPSFADRPGLRAFITHGRRDPIMEVGFGRRASEEAEAGGLAVEYHESDAAHHIDPAHIPAAVDWVGSALARI